MGLDKLKPWEKEPEKNAYVKAVLGDREIHIGPFDADAALLAEHKLKDAGEEGHLYNSSAINFERVTSDEPIEDAVSEEEFLRIADQEAPYQT